MESSNRNSLIVNIMASAALLGIIVLLLSQQVPGDGSSANVPTATLMPSNQPNNDDMIIQPTNLHGAWKDLLPFDIEQIEKITVQVQGMDQTITVPAERHNVILNNLSLLDLTNAGAEYIPKPLKPISIRFHVADRVYALSYDLDENEYMMNGQGFYANDQVMLLMHGLLQPDSTLAELDKMFEQARIGIEQHSGEVDKSFQYAEDLLQLSAMDYEAWDKLLPNLSSLKSTEIGQYYNEALQSVHRVVEYENGIIAISDSLVFTKPGYETTSGITVGVTQRQVLERLGEPNLKTPFQWSYRAGDDLKFHLYMEHNKVKYIVLTS